MYFHALYPPVLESREHAVAARAGRADALPRAARILVPYDGSRSARCALDYAIERAQSEACTLHVLNVQPDFAGKETGERILDAARARLEFADVSQTTVLAFGLPARCIVRNAAMERCDLIVMGTRDRLAIADFFSASVATQVVRLAHVPVTVVKQKVVATTHSPRRISTGKRRTAC